MPSRFPILLPTYDDDSYAKTDPAAQPVAHSGAAAAGIEIGFGIDRGLWSL